MILSFSLRLWTCDGAKSACVGAMENGIAAERRCVVGSMLSHFLPVVCWLGCIIIHFIHLLHCPLPALSPSLGRKVGVICLNRYIKGEAVALFGSE